MYIAVLFNFYFLFIHQQTLRIFHVLAITSHAIL